MCAEQGACVRRQSWAGYTSNIFEFEFATGTTGRTCGAVHLLGNDTLGAKLTSVRKDGGAILGNVFVKQDTGVSIAQQPRQSCFAFEKRRGRRSLITRPARGLHAAAVLSPPYPARALAWRAIATVRALALMVFNHRVIGACPSGPSLPIRIHGATLSSVSLDPIDGLSGEANTKASFPQHGAHLSYGPLGVLQGRPGPHRTMVALATQSTLARPAARPEGAF
jgi:hypothetical protein